MFVCEPSWFLIGRTFANLFGSIRRIATKLYSGSKKCHSTCSGNIHPIWWTLPLIGWEQNSPVDEEEIKIKMDDGIARFFTCFGGIFFFYLLTCGRHSLVLGIQNEIVVELPCEWLKYIDLTLAYIFDHAVCCACATSSGQSLHLITSQLRTK